MAKELVKTIRKGFDGFGKQQTKDMLMRSQILVLCTVMGKESLKIRRRQLDGLG